MTTALRVLLPILLLVSAASALIAAQNAQTEPTPEATEPLPEAYSCMFCHGEDGTLAGSEDDKNLVVPEAHLAKDVHWQKGLRCHDCHGGNPTLEEYVDHRDDPGFQPLKKPEDIPGFCGRCHSDIQYMRRYDPAARTDQEAEYWTSGHGQALKETGDPEVATCVDCHDRHGMLAVDDQQSPVYPTHVAETCAVCHADEELMADRTYRDRPLGHDQYDHWRQSVHGRAMLDKGDLSAPTCNDCHGNHGAMPPGVASVANACGTCHGKVADLFAETSMRHRFEELELPGCATCHGNHQTVPPSDSMLGMGDGSVCTECHEREEHEAPLAGADAAREMRDGLEQLKEAIVAAEEKVEEAERLGMPVRGPRFELRLAFDALTNARSLVHSFSKDRVNEALAEGLEVTSQVSQRAEAALSDYTWRRIWLAAFLIPILLVIVLLVLYIRNFPATSA